MMVGHSEMETTAYLSSEKKVKFGYKVYIIFLLVASEHNILQSLVFVKYSVQFYFYSFIFIALK